MDFMACWHAFLYTLLVGTQQTFIRGGSTLMSNP